MHNCRRIRQTSSCTALHNLMLQTCALCYPEAAAGLIPDKPPFCSQEAMPSAMSATLCLAAACCFFAGCSDCATIAYLRILCCHPPQMAQYGPPERLPDAKFAACILHILSLLQTAVPAETTHALVAHLQYIATSNMWHDCCHSCCCHMIHVNNNQCYS